MKPRQKTFPSRKPLSKLKRKKWQKHLSKSDRWKNKKELKLPLEKNQKNNSWNKEKKCMSSILS
jgi:hypothetical protein